MKQLLPTQRGLTLLELLITLSIAAILVGIAIPSFAHTIKRTNSNTIAYQMMGLVQFARTEAIVRRVPIALCGSTNGEECDKGWSSQILIFADNNSNGSLDTKENVLRVSSLLKPGETLSWSSFRNKPYLQLQPNGMTYFQNGNFTYCPADGDAHFAVHLILNASGRLRIAQDKNNDGIPEGSDGKNIKCQII